MRTGHHHRTAVYTHLGLCAPSRSLLPPPFQQLLAHAIPFWLLKAAAWVPSFAANGLLGFFAGPSLFCLFGSVNAFPWLE